MKQILLLVLIHCVLGEYCVLDHAYQTQIQKDFILFKDGITPQMISKIRQVDLFHKCYVRIVKGVPISSCTDSFYQLYHQILVQFAPQLPDMQFVMTLFDNPALYKNTCNNTTETILRTCECAEDYGDKFPQHAYFKRVKVFKLYDKIPVDTAPIRSTAYGGAEWIQIECLTGFWISVTTSYEKWS